MTERVERLRARLADEFAGAPMLVSSPANTRYLTGWTGFSHGLLVLPGRLLLFVDSRYHHEAIEVLGPPDRSDGVEIVSHLDRVATLRESLTGLPRLVIEADHMTVAEHAALDAALDGSELVASRDLLLEQRLVKDGREIETIRAAASVTDAVLDDLVAARPVGWTERQVAAFIVAALEEREARSAFEMIVASGPRTALPHTEPGTRRLEEDECLLVDFGAEIGGYKSDLTRVLWWGRLDDRRRQVIDVVREAYELAAGMLAPGVEYAAVDRAVAEFFEERDLGQFKLHPCGHNLGLEIHERPFFAVQHEGALSAGNVVTVEPALYVPGVVGARHENTMLVTDAGAVPLTSAEQYVPC